jgi:hypothetical protein
VAWLGISFSGPPFIGPAFIGAAFAWAPLVGAPLRSKPFNWAPLFRLAFLRISFFGISFFDGSVATRQRRVFSFAGEHRFERLFIRPSFLFAPFTNAAFFRLSLGEGRGGDAALQGSAILACPPLLSPLQLTPFGPVPRLAVPFCLCPC